MTGHAATQRWLMTPAQGGAGLVVAAAVAGSSVPADHSIEVALITTVGGVVAIVIGQVIAELLRRRRRNTRGGTDPGELIDHLLREIDDLHGEIARLKRRREP